MILELVTESFVPIVLLQLIFQGEQNLKYVRLFLSS